MDVAAFTVSIVAILMATFLGFLQLREARKQRHVSHQPELVALDASYVVTEREQPSEKNQLLIDRFGSRFPGAHPSWSFDLANVGTGAATAIEINWEFDAEAMVSLLADHLRKGVRLRLKATYLELSSGSSMAVVNMHRAVYANDNRPYMLPLGTGGASTPVHLPSAYVTLVGLACEALLSDHGASISTSGDFGPMSEIAVQAPLYLKVRYKDVEGCRREKSFSVEMHASVWRFEEQPTDKPFSEGRLIAVDKGVALVKGS